MEKINDMARQLLREMGYQAEGSPTADDVVVPREAAQNLGLDAGAPEYEAALNHLLALGDKEPNPDPALAEQGFYRLTRPCRVRVRELHTYERHVLRLSAEVCDEGRIIPLDSLRLLGGLG